MTLPEIISDALIPAFVILPEPMDSATARVMLLTIGQQESRFLYRRQVNGPAKGFWQFEQGGGVKGVINHPSTSSHCRNLARARGVDFTAPAIFNALEFDDVLAAGVARLLLFADSKPLPAIKDAEACWDCYVRNWRPGRPHRDTWDAFHAEALKAVEKS